MNETVSFSYDYNIRSSIHLNFQSRSFFSLIFYRCSIEQKKIIRRDERRSMISSSFHSTLTAECDNRSHENNAEIPLHFIEHVQVQFTSVTSQ